VSWRGAGSLLDVRLVPGNESMTRTPANIRCPATNCPKSFEENSKFINVKIVDLPISSLNKKLACGSSLPEQIRLRLK
jgi:hypothetical protein